ncbi:MAG: hypothetical protein LBO63_06900 [Oscillospiraceae bacterium]|jgi:hypothetical protein|nr:hypothetical protein [Oscillospiraceae bacterium]
MAEKLKTTETSDPNEPANTSKQPLNFQKLTPTDEVELGTYLNALDFVFENDDLTNVAISGAYGAGKSSILESYKARRSNKRFIHISLAHFETTESKEKQQSKTTPPEIKQAVLEGKILNQLIHQISQKNIPQTNFRVKREAKPHKIISWAIGAVLFALLLLHTIFFETWQTYVENLTHFWLRQLLSRTTNSSVLLVTGLLLAVAIGLCVFHIIKAQINRSILKKISADKLEIEIFKDSDDSFFDKYLNEVLYLFEKCDADVIVFEDLDRYDVNHIFERLREINSLINAKRKKGRIKEQKPPLRFLYLLRDDIFTSKDRTKFFDFIIPIVPIIDGSNSYNKFIELSNNTQAKIFDDAFLRGLSLYIDDMRILKNIYNEYLIYESRVNKIELNHDKLLAIIVYKNLFPQDFNDLQLRKGFVFALFDENRVNNIRANKLTALNEDLKKARDAYPKNSKIEDKIGSDAEMVAIESELGEARFATLKELINPGNIDEIFAVTSTNAVGKRFDYTAVRSNKYFDLLKYLIRDGYIDESYTDYMTYFYPNSLTTRDKIFLRSVTDQKPKESTYKLDNPEMVFAWLSERDFEQPAVVNNDLLFFLLKSCAKFQRVIEDSGKDEAVSMVYNSYEPYFEEDNSIEIKRLVNMLYLFPKTDMDNLFDSVKDVQLNYLVNCLNAFYAPKLSHTNSETFVFRTLIATDVDDMLTGKQDKPIFLESHLKQYISAHSSLISRKAFDNLENLYGTGVKDPSKEVVGIAQLPDKFVKKLIRIGVRFTDLDPEQARQSIFELVYLHNLYELNFGNISRILKSEYGITSDEDIAHKSYTLIRSKPKSSLAMYVKDNIDGYIAVVLDTYDAEIDDERTDALAILNNENVSEEHKAEYIRVYKRIWYRLTDITDKSLWQLLIENKRVSHNVQNTLDYFSYCGYELTYELRRFIVDSNIDSQDYTTIRKTYDDEALRELFNAVIKCNDLDNAYYSQILKSLDFSYSNSFDIEDISDDKVLILVDIGVIRMATDSLLFMREHYPNAVLPYITKNIEKYITEIIEGDSFEFDLKEVQCVVASNEPGVTDKRKQRLLHAFCKPITAQNKAHSDTIKEYILLHNLDTGDLQHFILVYSREKANTKSAIERITVSNIDAIFENSYTIDKALVDKLLSCSDIPADTKQKLFALLLPNFDIAQCTQYLQQLKLNDLLSLFDGKLPLIHDSDINERILNIFKTNNWISSFALDKKSTDCFRPYIRKSATRDWA